MIVVGGFALNQGQRLVDAWAVQVAVGDLAGAVGFLEDILVVVEVAGGAGLVLAVFPFGDKSH